MKRREFLCSSETVLPNVLSHT